MRCLDRMPAWLRCALCLAFVPALLTLPAPARAGDLPIVPARDGAIGAWLVAGPLYSDPLPPGRQQPPIDVRLAAPVGSNVPFRLLTSTDDRFDLKALLHAGDNAIAVFGARLRVAVATRLLLILGADDALSVSLDRDEIYRRDEVRPVLHDDDAVAFAASPGEHTLLIRSKQHKGPWQVRARLLDAADLLPPAGVTVILPGVDDQSSPSIAESMAAADVALEPAADRYHVSAHIRWPGGLPAGIDVPLRAHASISRGASARQLYDVSLGAARGTDRGVFELHASLPDILAADCGAEEQGGKLALAVVVGNKTFTFDRPTIPEVRSTIARIDSALSDTLPARHDALVDGDVVDATLRLARQRLVKLVAEGDTDTAATLAECRAIGAFVDRLNDNKDPIRAGSGPMRLGYRSPLDGQIHPFGLYVPPALARGAGKKLPLVVALHGLNGLPMQMLRIFFGQDDPAHLAPWEDRHVGELPELDAFVLAPSGFGNLSYREAGEVDVMALRDWAVGHLPIDPDRVYVTGLSMGGTGAAHVALRYPEDFAAAMPLCGYHSYAFRSDIAGRVLRPWERALSEYWSTVSWAENGLHLPMLVVHGKKDLPVKNSGVLIDRYNALGYSMVDEHPDVGHNVWQMTYEGFKAFRWLMRHQAVRAPRRVELKTSSMRYADHEWVHVAALRSQLAWGRVSARVASSSAITVTTSGVDAFRMDPPASLVDAAKPVTVTVDGESLTFAPGEQLAAHFEEGWKSGMPPAPSGLYKRRGSSGPITDVFHEPLVFVYGTQDPATTRLGYEVATTLARPKFGVEASWPVVADVDVDDALASSHALFLVGNARSNRYLAKIEPGLPIRVEADSIVVGARRFAGDAVGAMFIHPNPAFPDRYVVVLEGADVTGLLRGLSLPRLLPDFIVYDQAIAGARGQMVAGSARVLLGGMFTSSWAVPDDAPAAPER